MCKFCFKDHNSTLVDQFAWNWHDLYKLICTRFCLILAIKVRGHLCYYDCGQTFFRDLLLIHVDHLMRTLYVIHDIDGLMQDLQYLQCISNGDTAVLHWTINMLLLGQWESAQIFTEN